MDQRAVKITDLLVGKVVKVVRMHSTTEIMIEFSDGTRIFVNSLASDIEVLVTGGKAESDMLDIE